MKKRKKTVFTETRKLLFIVILFSIQTTFSQIHKSYDTKSIFKFLAGEQPKESIAFMPGGTHLSYGDFIDVWYVGYTYKGFEYIAFKNSFNHPTLAAVYKRTIKPFRWISINYGIGLMLGYDGKLKDHPEIPLSNTFLYSGNLNPIMGLDFGFKVHKKVDIQISMASWVLLYGLKYYL